MKTDSWRSRFFRGNQRRGAGDGKGKGMDEQEKKKRQEKAYQEYVKTKTPVHNVYLNMAKAFVTGGSICVIGQFLMNFCKNAGCTQRNRAVHGLP